MKESKYNIYLKYKDVFVLYNTLYESILMLSDIMYRKLQEIGIEKCFSINENLYDKVVDGNFLIDDSFDELQEVKRIIRQKDFSDDEYHLIINPTLDCNFNCWYCFEQKVRGSYMTPKIQNSCSLLIQNIIKSNANLKKFTLSFFGGEPILYYNRISIPLMKSLYTEIEGKNIEANIHFTTNGYLLNDSVISSMSKFKVKSLQITFDGDREIHNQTRFLKHNTGSYDVIINNIKRILFQTDISIILRINYTHQNIDGFMSLLEEISKFKNLNHIVLSPNQVWQDRKKDDNFDEKINVIYNRAEELGILTKNASSIGRLKHPCYADKKNQACINYNGLVYKCNARNFDEGNALGILNEQGTIIWNEKENIWMDSKLKNQPCKDCIILPICAGGCRRLSFNHIGETYCIYNFDEERKKQAVLEMLLREKV